MIRRNDKKRAARSPGRILVTTGLCLAALSLFVFTSPVYGFRIWGVPFISEHLPTATPAVFVHWDLREFPNCLVPYATSNVGVVDLNNDGNANDQAAFDAAVAAALQSWTNVAPAVIQLAHRPAAAVANRPVRMDGVNVIGFGAAAGDDVADPAPVGSTGHGVNTPIIGPGSNGVLDSVPAGDDGVGMLGMTMIVHSGVNGIINTPPAVDDEWILGRNVGANVNIIAPGPNGQLDTVPFKDDGIAGNRITSGANGLVQTVQNNQSIGGALGSTGSFVNNQTGRILESDIILTTNAANAIWRVGTQDRINPPPNLLKDVQGTVAHELGHSIGISHPEEVQMIARNQGAPGQVCVNGAGVGGALSPATLANLAGDDQTDAGNTQVFTGPDGICQTAAAGGDAQVIMVGRGAGPNFFAVLQASDGVLTTTRNPDDTACNDNGNPAICVGPNGIANSGFTLANTPTMNQFINPFNASLQEQSLAQDDQDACNWLYTPDLGDAPDPWGDPPVFNRYQSLVHSTTNTRMLNGIQLTLPAQGPYHQYGYTRAGASFRYEWLGTNEDGHASECEARVPNMDLFDDGVAAPNPLIRGQINRVTVTISHSAQVGRYVAGNMTRSLHFNGYMDFLNDCLFSPGDLEIWWSGVPAIPAGPGNVPPAVPCTTTANSANFVPPAVCAANSITLKFDVWVPLSTKDEFYCRYRLDYGEDEGRVQDISGDNDPAEGASQFGEVEDYPCAAQNKPSQDILPGIDLLVTPPGSFDSSFTVNPIPGGFFGPGSDPFNQILTLEGDPLPNLGGPSTGQADTIIARLAAAILPRCGDTAQIPIQIVALNLVSSVPIFVTFNGGQNPQAYDVRVVLSDTPQIQGFMDITAECRVGGTFDSFLPVMPKFIFTPQAGGLVQVLDLGPAYQVDMETTDTPWVREAFPSFMVNTVGPGVIVDANLDGNPEPPLAIGTGPFFPTIRAVPCDCTNPPFDEEKNLNPEQALLAEHGIIVSQGPDTPCGDLDSDGDVDGADFGALLDSFGSQNGDGNYNAGADFDQDGAITLVDYQAWIKCYRGFVGDPLAPPPVGTPAGDMNWDGTVDLNDFLEFSHCFSGGGGGVSIPCIPGDLDRDGDVDLADFITFAANYGTSN